MSPPDPQRQYAENESTSDGLLQDHHHRPGKTKRQSRIRDLRITVYDVLDYLAGGMTHQDILADFPDLTEEDIRAFLAYAAGAEPRLQIVLL